MASVGQFNRPSTSKTHPRTKGFSKGKGESFEQKISGYLFLRCLELETKDFIIASNAAGAGAFDDVVLRYKKNGQWHTLFIQLKHKENASATVTYNKLIGNGKKNNIRLYKYFQAYCEIKKNMEGKKDPASVNVLLHGPFENCTFIFCTNSKASYTLKKISKDESVGDIGNILKMGPIKGTVLNFSGNEGLIEYLKKCKDSGSTSTNINVDDTDITKFLHKFVFICDQPNEETFGDLIKEKLTLLCTNGIDADLVDSIFNKELKAWWQEAKFGNFLSKSNNILTTSLTETNIKSFKIGKISEGQKARYRLTINFESKSLSKLKTIFKKLMKSGKQLTVTHGEIPPELCCTKLLQIIDENRENCLFTGTSSLSQNKDAAFCAWEKGEKHLLVIVGEIQRGNGIWKSIKETLKTFTNKRVIHICSEKPSLSGQGQEYLYIADTFDVLDLTEESLNALRHREVTFQGGKIKFMKRLDFSDEGIKSVLNSRIVEIVNSPTFSEDQLLANNSSTHIPRSLEYSNTINEEILEGIDEPYKILFSGITKEELTRKYSKYSEREVVGNERDSPFCDTSDLTGIFQFYVSTEKPAEEYQALCNKYDNVHWIKFEGETFKWARSQGDKSAISKYVNREITTECKVKTINNLPGRLILIEGVAGMGKTSWMKQLVSESRKALPGQWIVHVNLNDVSPDKFDQDNPVDFLISACGIKPGLVADFLRASITYAGNVFVLMDGFVEKCPQYVKACKIIKSLLETTKVSKVCVTSRPLQQNQFPALPMRLMKMNEVMQKALLNHNTWSKKFKKTFSLVERGNSLAGNPIQTLISSDILKHKQRQMEKLSPLELWMKFVLLKFEIYFQPMQKNSSKTQLYKIKYNEIESKHKTASIVLMIDQKMEKNMSMSTDSKLSKVDILPNNTVYLSDFFLRVLVDYFAAKWIKNRIRSKGTIHGVPCESNFTFLFYTFDKILSVFTSDQRKQEQQKQQEQQEQQGSYLASKLKFTEQDSMTNKFICSDFVQTTVSNESNLQSKIKTTTWQFVENEIKITKEKTNLFNAFGNFKEDKELWDILISHDLEKVFSELLEEGLSLHSKFNEEPKPTLLHKSAERGTIKVCELLVKKDKSLVKNEDDDTQTPLHYASSNGHNAVVKCLLNSIERKEEKIGYINKIAQYSISALHLASKAGRANVVNTLKAAGADINIVAGYETSPLHMASKNGHAFIVKQLLNCDFNNDSERTTFVNKQDGSGKTALLLAAEQGHCNVVTILIDAKADITKTDNRKSNILHLTSSRGYEGIVKYVVNYLRNNDTKLQEILKTLINAKDKHGSTPLSSAKDSNHHKIYNILLETTNT